jgi:hypothetical protein
MRNRVLSIAVGVLCLGSALPAAAECSGAAYFAPATVVCTNQESMVRVANDRSDTADKSSCRRVANAIILVRDLGNIEVPPVPAGFVIPGAICADKACGKCEEIYFVLPDSPD